MRVSWLTLTLAVAGTLFAAGCGEKDPSDGPDDSSSGDDSNPTEEVDADGDGFVAAEDCDDGNPDIHPDAAEVCDGRDNNCDGAADDDDPNVSGQGEWYADEDGDGYGDNDADAVLACEAPDGTAEAQGDCDDGDSAINPSAPEVCDAADNNCDELVDAADPALTDGAWYYPDSDEDGYGASDGGQYLCEQPSGYLADSSDCDDDDRQVKPGGRERCTDGVDNNCDGATDSDDASCGGSSEPTTWTGQESFLLGFDRKPNVLLCEMYWTTSGTKSSMTCPECLYTFDITSTYDAASSSYSYEGCADIAADSSTTYGIDEDFYGYGFGVLWAYGTFYDSTSGGYVTTWGAVMYANWDSSAKRVDYYIGYENYPYSYNGKTYYYTNYTSGYGQLK